MKLATLAPGAVLGGPVALGLIAGVHYFTHPLTLRQPE
jgi:hypothetical protein